MSMWLDLFERGPKLAEPPKPEEKVRKRKKTCKTCHMPYLLKHFLVPPFDVCQKCKTREKLGRAP